MFCFKANKLYFCFVGTSLGSFKQNTIVYLEISGRKTNAPHNLVLHFFKGKKFKTTLFLKKN